MTLLGLIFLVVVGTSIWVFFDAPARSLSWTWGLGCLALWIVAFPWYLVERNKAKPLAVGARPGEWLPDPVDPERLERRKEDGRWTRDVRARRVLPAGAEEGGHQTVRRPRATLLPNGDVLAPAGDGLEMVRIAVGTPECGEWVAQIQSEQEA